MDKEKNKNIVFVCHKDTIGPVNSSVTLTILPMIFDHIKRKFVAVKSDHQLYGFAIELTIDYYFECNKSIEKAASYGFRTESYYLSQYLPVTTLCAVMKEIDDGLADPANSDNPSNTFGHYVLKIANILGVKQFAEPFYIGFITGTEPTYLSALEFGVDLNDQVFVWQNLVDNHYGRLAI